MHLSLVHSSIYSTYAQTNIIPAQYFRNYASEEEMEKYYAGNEFLRDINNERSTDTRGEPSQARNATYKENFESLNKLVLLQFS
jgi:palmitoyl-protein thioesterase